MQVNCAEHAVEEEDYDPQQLDEELNTTKQSVDALHANLNEQNEKRVNLLNETPLLHEKIDGTANPGVQRLISIMKLLKDLEREDSNFQSNMNAKRSELQDEVNMLEEGISSGWDNINGLGNSFHKVLEKLNLAKRELAARLREILFLKQQIDDVPSQTELIQYEHRFSELYVHIQGKHQKTRTYYATYNALLEKKELMLKETSLLNSISSQFQEAFSTDVGRTKLVDSMEGILKGTQQKLERVQLTLQAEQKACDALKEKYAASVLQQRHCSSLLKAFQEECTRNERLRSTHFV